MGTEYHDRLRAEEDTDQLRNIGLTLASEVELLRNRLARLTTRLAKAEHRSPEDLFADEASAHDAAMALTTVGSNGGSLRSPNNPRTDNQKPKPKPPVSGRGEPEQSVLELDEADQICPECGGDLRHRPSLDHKSTLITLQHTFIREIEVTRCGYGCGCGHIEHALPHDDQFQTGGRYGIPLVVTALVLKYWQAMPLNRQVKFWAGHGLDITSQSLWNNVWAATNLLRPVYDELVAQAQRADVLHADETRWQVRRGKGKHWVWVFGTDEVQVFVVRPGRDHTIAEEFLRHFDGTLVVDGMSAYTKAIDNLNARRDNPELWEENRPPPELGPIVRAGCWAHTRTYWRTAEADFPAASAVVHKIGKLFRIVRGAEECDVDDELRLHWVDAALDDIGETVRQVDATPGTSLQAAKTYTTNQWDRLRVFRDRRVPPHNNLAEQALRSPVLGRLNFQGAKSERGNRAAEIFYSLMATCAINGISPPDYLEAAIVAARDGNVLTPADYANQA